ncbi:B12-binding domain-containing protein [Novosphingobium piscinae]|uniref:Cobalamin B12-binding domain-containing protein n=1 Tax=Novosphingobium piscinae TaxID=1507448 RepID=A0A7X1KPK3_9SPHN|nr:cobalamin-dependent protein [Novosphingobium piscinae]MBC2668520.1 cobalamin B12-binding domain-containing protein [Novosphingobium piscinae]
MATVYGAGTAKRSGRAGRGRSGVSRSGAGRGVREPSRGSSPTSLNSLINEQIIPRLLQAHTPEAGSPRPVPAAALDPVDAAQFASLPLILEADELLTVVEQFLIRGVPVESVLVDLLAPSARRLGQHWDEDDCDFLDVTMGLWRLQEVMREITLRFPPRTDRSVATRSALFAPMPGDDHSMGALMVEEVFARAGWQTEVLTETKRPKLLQILGERSFDLVGLTVSCDCSSAVLGDLISAMRIVSKTRDLQILIGGRMVNANPGLVEAVGADGSAADARSALALADRLVKVPARPDLPRA